jgi:serine/threonine protein kinase
MTDTLTWSPTAILSEPPAAAPPAPEPTVHDALPAATRLDEFEVIRVLGAGGFGIVYLALDHVLLRYVAIKEYMPAALAGRGSGQAVAVRSPSHADTYAIGLESFFNEARMLASFDHPSLVKVHRFWKANGTAYMAMQYYPGRTLREVRGEMQTMPDEAWLRACVEPLLGAIESLHAEDIYHRDIAPDNILLLPDGRPVLLDFGSARRVIGDRTQSLTAVLKPNFAPIEQYADEPGMRQGPWTDLYALGATMHFMLTGQVPVPAVLRAVRDTLRAVSDTSTSSFPDVGTAFLATVDWTLALAPEDRPQSVATLRRGLSGEVQAPPPSARHQPPPREVADASLRLPVEKADPDLPPKAEVTPPPAPLAVRRHRGLALACSGISLVVVVALVAARLLSTPASANAGAAPSRAAATAVSPPPAAPVAAPASNMVASASSPSIRREPARAMTRPAIEARAARPPAPPVPSATAGRTALPVAQEAAAAAVPAKSPRELCGDVNFLALALCVSRQCQSPALQSHPQCIEARRYDEQRRRRMEQ